MIFLQLVIAFTGNYCFFNLLTIALCLLLIDDSVVCRGSGSLPVGRLTASPTATGALDRRALPDQLRSYAATAVLIVTLPINAWLIFTAFKPDADWPRPLVAIYSRLQPFRLINGYGLFRVMTKDRDEIVIEGSADGVDWLPYEFKWKPGDVMRAPGWCAPHQPRLDWQMWFAALGSYRENPWFVRLIVQLLEGSQDVSRLLETNPFPHEPPRYIRAMFYRYRFTTSRERRETGAWWKREQLREYLPTVSADQLRQP
jgi:lipase maturation factor 1